MYRLCLLSIRHSLLGHSLTTTITTALTPMQNPTRFILTLVYNSPFTFSHTNYTHVIIQTNSQEKIKHPMNRVATFVHIHNFFFFSSTNPFTVKNLSKKKLKWSSKKYKEGDENEVNIVVTNVVKTTLYFLYFTKNLVVFAKNRTKKTYHKNLSIHYYYSLHYILSSPLNSLQHQTQSS